jgi:uncharacterized protein involved in exopolysaccharide biosynthesis
MGSGRMKGSSMQEGSVDLRPFFSFVWKKKIPIGLGGLALGVIAFLYTYLLPPVWRAATVILLPQPMSGSSLPSAAAVLGSDADPLAIIQGIIQSHPAQKYVSEQTGMSVPEVLSQVAVTTNGPNQQVMVTFDDRRKAYALKVVQSVLDILTELSGKTDVSQAATQARYYEEAVHKKAKDLADAEAAVLKFQQQTITAPDPSTPFSGTGYTRRLRDNEFDLQSTKQAIDVAKKQAALQGSSSSAVPTALTANQRWFRKLTDLQYELGVLDTRLGPQAPEVVAKQKEINVTKSQLQSQIAKELTSINEKLDPNMASLEAKRLLLQYQHDLLLKMSNIAPKEAVDFQRLVREALAQADLYKDIRGRYETARIQAQVERAKWSVLAEPYILEGATNKTFVRNILLGVLLGLLATSLLLYRKQVLRLRSGAVAEA